MPLTLVVDSCTEILYVALVAGGVPLVDLRLALAQPHSKTLMATVDWALRQAALAPGQIEQLVVGRGPGSFSGLRIGMASMQGLARALSVPLYSFVGHDLIACKFAYVNRVFAVLTDARRQQLYWTLYSSDGYKPTRLSDCRVDDPETLAQCLPEKNILLLGSGVDVYRSRLKAALPQAELIGVPQALPDLGLFVQLPVLAEGQAEVADTLPMGLSRVGEKLEMLYVRPSDAELNRDKKLREPVDG
ncbi:MAG: tRNA (adenosine(37)-N6)-threonylcarbamoyltransferase complex dimerization subunit type 1 TsaB [Deltaproteobacteria bacterium]|nr:tRNA (adenosine(37)-N6)-threonylcarbamoyltransferase complex dimerization subunit type 1 TsaB [Deltaproteobacteria bacterium]